MADFYPYILLPSGYYHNSANGTGPYAMGPEGVFTLVGLSSSSSGGVSTFAALTDKATADIPSINTPTSTALAAKADGAATTAALALKAPLASPTLTGTPAAPTASPGTNTTQIATTAFVLANGGATTFAALTDKASADIPATNTPTATALSLKAPLASPALTGTPTAPTAAASTNTTQIATTGFVANALAAFDYSDLTDATTVDLPMVNTPLSEALSDLQEAIDGITFEGGTDNAYTLYEIANGANQVITAPGALDSGGYGVHTFILRKLGATVGTISTSGFVVDGPLMPLQPASATEVTIPSYSTDGGVSWHIGMSPGDSIGTWAWADLNAISATTYDGCVASVTGVLLDVNGSSTARTVMMIAQGGRWRYQEGPCTLRNLAAATTPHSGTSFTAMSGSVTFPAGLLAVGDEFEAWYASSKVGANGTTTFAVYIGNQGDATDVAVYSPAAITAANLSYAYGPMIFRVVSATTVQMMGNGATAPLWNGSQPGSVPSVSGTLDNMITSAMKLSFSQHVASASDTVSATYLRVTHRMA